MSDANLTALLYAAETAFAETPDLGSTLQELRFVSESLVHNKNTIVSEELRSDRARSDLIQAALSAEGEINCELVLEAYNDLILAGLMASAWVSGQASITATSNATAQTITATVGTFATAQQTAKYAKVAGFANSGNNGIFRVVSCTSTVMTLAAGSLTGADETTKSGVTVDYKYARNGTTLTSFLIEKQFNSLDPAHYVAMVGGVVNEMSLSLEARAIARLNFGMMGSKLIAGAATYGDGSPTAVSTNPVCNATGNIGTILWNGSALGANAMSFDMTLNNNLRDRPAISHLSSLVYGKGTIDLTGSLNCYFEDPTMLTALLAHTSADLFIPIIDADGNVMSIHLPELKFSNGTPQAEGINTDLMANMEFQALVDPTLGYVIQVDQLAA